MSGGRCKAAEFSRLKSRCRLGWDLTWGSRETPASELITLVGVIQSPVSISLRFLVFCPLLVGATCSPQEPWWNLKSSPGFRSLSFSSSAAAVNFPPFKSLCETWGLPWKWPYLRLALSHDVIQPWREVLSRGIRQDTSLRSQEVAGAMLEFWLSRPAFFLCPFKKKCPFLRIFLNQL